MGGAAVDLSHPGLHQGVASVDCGAAGKNLVIKGQGHLALDVANDVQGFGVVGVVDTALFDNGQRAVQVLGHVAGALGDADIYGHDHQVLNLLGLEIVGHDGHGGQFVYGNIEEALDLTGVQVNGQQAVGPGCGQQVSHQAGGNGNPGLVLFVGAAVAIIRDYGGNTPGRRPLAGVDHDEQFHQVVVNRGAGGLDYEYIPLADVLHDADESVVVGELEHLGLTQGNIQVVADRLGQNGVRVSAENSQGIGIYQRAFSVSHSSGLPGVAGGSHTPFLMFNRRRRCHRNRSATGKRTLSKAPHYPPTSRQYGPVQRLCDYSTGAGAKKGKNGSRAGQSHYV